MASIWILAFILSVIPLTGIPYFKDFSARSSVCLPLHLTSDKPSGWEYSVFLYLSVNFYSFICIFIMYTCMFWTIRRTQQQSGSNIQEAALATRMVLIVLTDFCCWIPIIGIGIASLSGWNAPQDVYAWIAVFVLPLNSALNPVLYTISTKKFRQKIAGKALCFASSGTVGPVTGTEMKYRNTKTQEVPLGNSPRLTRIGNCNDGYLTTD